MGGARKLLRKYYSSNAVETVGDEAIKLTGHDLRSTLDKHYWKQQKGFRPFLAATMY